MSNPQADRSNSGDAQSTPTEHEHLAFSGALEELVSLSERELQATFVEPLLRNMGFKNVYDTSGPRERGKDVIATKDSFGRSELYAIQIKKFKPSGKHGSKGSFGALLDQLRSAVFEPVLDPSTNHKRPPNRVVFITPYPIPPHLREDFEERADARELRGLALIDGPQLLDLIREHLPEAVKLFSVQSQYRLRLAADVSNITEARVAFDTTRDINLDQIYVDALMGLGDSTIYRIAKARFKRRNRARRVSHVKADALDQLLADWTEQPSAHLPRKESKEAGKMGEVSLSIGCLFDAIAAGTQTAMSAVSALTCPNTTVSAYSEAVDTIISVARKIERLRSDEAFRLYWSDIEFDLRPTDQSIGAFTSDVLVKIDRPIFILGPPGSGKTTLLKRMSQAAASESNEMLPIFLPMVLLRDGSPGGIIRACGKQMERLGFQAAHGALEARMNSHGLWMCLDGLDEAGKLAKEAFHAVQSLLHQYPKCRIILSSRDTVNYGNFENAFVVKLSPFSDLQLDQFISKWFSSEPSARGGLAAWLGTNKSMKQVARTPLIAASLCSLYEAHAEMPQTEVELYQKRFELLLGKWEQAKGVAPMQNNVRKRYLHFLRLVAFRLHKSERRAMPLNGMIDLAKRFYVGEIHGEPSGLVLDCLRRGLFEEEATGGLSLGHLTYQEFLTAEHLMTLNPADEIWERLLDPWWKNTLDFYAALRWDISNLFVLATKKPLARIIKDRLADLTRLAPLTPPELLDAIRVDSRIEI